MTTLKHLERLFLAHQFRRLYRELVVMRPEGSFALDSVLGSVVPASALALLRMDELSQSHSPLFRRMLNVVLTSQEPDGGLGDPMVSAVCIRALMCGDGQGHAVERGLTYLANLQKNEGLWPKEPLRRMPADPFVSAFVLLQLGDRQAFRQAVRFDDVLDWFAVNAKAMDPEAKRLWDHAAMRCRATSRQFTPSLWTAGRPAA